MRNRHYKCIHVINFFYKEAQTKEVKNKEKDWITNFKDQNESKLADWKGGTVPFLETFQHWINELPLAHSCEHLVKLLTR